MHRSASPRPGYSTGRSGSLALGSPRLGARDRAIAQLQGDESPALSFLARRGSEAQNTDSDSDDSLERQVAMANAERELKVRILKVDFFLKVKFFWSLFWLKVVLISAQSGLNWALGGLNCARDTFWKNHEMISTRFEFSLQYYLQFFF